MITQKYTGMPHKSGQRSKIHENTHLNDAYPGQLHADLVSLLVGVCILKLSWVFQLTG